MNDKHAHTHSRIGSEAAEFINLVKLKFWVINQRYHL